MLKKIQIVSLTGVLALLPVVSVAQTCKPESIQASTPTSRFTDNHNGTVTDTKTGLQWKRCSEGQMWNGATNGCDGSATVFTWKAALEQAQTANVTGGGLGIGGSWRVPNIKELRSIIEVQCGGPAINLAVFPNTDTSAAVWSSSLQGFQAGAWIVENDLHGSGECFSEIDCLHSVRLVRNESDAPPPPSE